VAAKNYLFMKSLKRFYFQIFLSGCCSKAAGTESSQHISGSGEKSCFPTIKLFYQKRKSGLFKRMKKFFHKS